MNFQSNWMKFGLYYAVAAFVLQLISFYVLPIGLWSMMFLGIALLIFFLVIAGKAERAENGNVLSYGEAFKTCFLVALVGTIISGVLSMIMMNVVDTGLQEKVTQMALDSTKSMMESFGVPADQMEEAIEKAEEEMANQFTPVGNILNMVKGILFNVIPVAITAIFLKKEEKVF